MAVRRGKLEIALTPTVKKIGSYIALIGCFKEIVESH